MLAYLLAVKMLQASKKEVQLSDTAAIYSRWMGRGNVYRVGRIKWRRLKREKVEQREKLKLSPSRQHTSVPGRAKGLGYGQQQTTDL